MTNVVILVFGLVFLFEAIKIPAGFADSIGPRLVPVSVAIATIGLTLLLMLVDWRTADPEETSHDITARNLLVQAGPMLMLAVLSGLMIGWLGYLLATAIGGVVIFRLFANSWRLSLANGLACAIVFYLLFIKGMGIYDPPGTILDISNYLIW
nr:tripartite tricarboxylate transporter TctB family protein [Phaeobacter sp. J2-8]